LIAPLFDPAVGLIVTQSRELFIRQSKFELMFIDRVSSVAENNTKEETIKLSGITSSAVGSLVLQAKSRTKNKNEKTRLIDFIRSDSSTHKNFIN
jgi:hypothetical protein